MINTGSVSLVLTALLAATGAVALYMIAAAAITFLAVGTIRERYRRDRYEVAEPEARKVSS